MSELTDLVSRLEHKYGTPPDNIPKDDPDYVTLQRKYWSREDKRTENGGRTRCKVINLETKEEHVFDSFAQASKFYGHSKRCAYQRYIAKRGKYSKSKYKVIKL